VLVAAELQNLRIVGDLIADKVGLVLNLRVKDNLYQAIAVASTTALGALVGFIFGGVRVALSGAFGGLVVGGLASGLVLMIIGLTRK